jgi:FdhD protein
MTEPIRTVDVWRNGGPAHTDQVAVETPVALVFNGISHAVMMATPADLEAFALGFALSEGLLLSRAECYGIEVVEGDAGIEVQIDVATAAEVRLKDQRRSLAGRTGCGLCGIDSLVRLDLAPEALVPAPWVATLTPDTVQRALAAMGGRQPINAATGACHAAGWADPRGDILDVAEDVGRHNALDKLLGRRAAAGLANGEGFVVMSSRASYELVRKCARLGVPALATISAPTSLAIDIARAAGLTLYGFVRPGQAVRYAGGHPGRPLV